MVLTLAVISIGLSGCNPRLVGTIMKGVGGGIVEDTRHQAELRRAQFPTRAGECPSDVVRVSGRMRLVQTQAGDGTRSPGLGCLADAVEVASPRH